MDPNANLRAQERLILEIRARAGGDKETLSALREELRDLRSDLRYWLRNKGFHPDWEACPVASEHFMQERFPGTKERPSLRS